MTKEIPNISDSRNLVKQYRKSSIHANLFW